MSLVAVIGGGPAGMMAAAVASKRGNKVILIEKNKMLGKKLLITGKGRCNLTNSADIEEFIKNTPVNPSFLYSAFYSFTNEDLISLINKLGVETKVERGGRVFPKSDMSKDILNALKKLLANYSVKVYQGEVKDIEISENEKKIIFSDNKCLRCDKIIIATGGASYPLTGSTGDGYRFAKKIGHTVTKLKPSLIPIETNEEYAKNMQGLSLKNVEISVYKKNKKIFTDFGEMLFTHFGISGPLVLSASSHMRDEDFDDYKIQIDLKPALDEATLDKRILRDFDEFKNKDFVNSLKNLLPIKMIPEIIKLSNILEHKKVNEITKEERRRLVELIKRFPLTPKCFRPIEEAIITSGGVSVKEINPSTMESKLCEGVFFAGEIIDVDAYTGGFNLQIAFSTGYLAGKNV
ncbi:MAG: NAD(P)/FAD-dependent oxidoreductase [Ruminococcaceae bacterium]|nr:NAD(P)/FAD-dependent oxidoreductase [Oscillospiraceae bacterium]